MCVARVLILLAARKSYDFSPGVGKTTCLSENVFETFGRPFSLASAIQYKQLLRTPAALVIARRSVVSAGSRSLTSTTCICSTLLYQRYLGFGKGASSKSALPKRFCLGTRMLADFLRSVVEGPPSRIFYQHGGVGKIPRVGLGGAARCQ